jgi:hypothetical protein
MTTIKLSVPEVLMEQELLQVMNELNKISNVHTAIERVGAFKRTLYVTIDLPAITNDEIAELGFLIGTKMMLKMSSR